jgi:hypothetical protein
MGKAQTSSNSECHTPSSEPFRFYLDETRSQTLSSTFYPSHYSLVTQSFDIHTSSLELQTGRLAQ